MLTAWASRPGFPVSRPRAWTALARNGRYPGVDLGSPLGVGRRRLGQLPVPAGQRDADQLRVVSRVEGKEREEGQALVLALRRQPPAGLSGVAAGLGLQGQEPGGVPLDTRHPGPEHDPGDGRGKFGLPLVRGVQGDTAEDDHAVGVEHAEDEVGVVGAEAPFERGGGVGQVPELQQLAGPAGLEQLQRPALAALLGGTDALGGRGQRLAEAVHDGQDPAAEGTGLPLPGVLADLGAAAQSGVGEGERCLEVAAGVLERGFSQLQGETRGAVAGLLDGLLRLLE